MWSNFSRKSLQFSSHPPHQLQCEEKGKDLASQNSDRKCFTVYSAQLERNLTNVVNYRLSRQAVASKISLKECSSEFKYPKSSIENPLQTEGKLSEMNNVDVKKVNTQCWFGNSISDKIGITEAVEEKSPPFLTLSSPPISELSGNVAFESEFGQTKLVGLHAPEDCQKMNSATLSQQQLPFIYNKKFDTEKLKKWNKNADRPQKPLLTLNQDCFSRIAHEKNFVGCSYARQQNQVQNGMQSCFLEPVSFRQGNLVNYNNNLKPEDVKMEGATDDTSRKDIMVDSAGFQQRSTVQGQENVSNNYTKKRGSSMQVPSPSAISMKFRSAGKRLLQPLMKTWMKTILTGPRLLSLAPLTVGDTRKSTTNGEIIMSSGSGKSVSKEGNSDERTKTYIKRRTQREKTPCRNLLGENETKNSEPVALKRGLSKRKGLLATEPSVKKIHPSCFYNSPSRSRSIVFSTTKQCDIPRLCTFHPEQSNKIIRNSSQYHQHRAAAMTDRYSVMSTTATPLMEVYGEEFQALVFEHVQKCISTSFSCASFKKLVLEIAREEIQRNCERLFNKENNPTDLGVTKCTEEIANDTGGISIGPWDSDASVVRGPHANISHKNGEGEKLLFSDSQFSELSSLTDINVSSHQTFPLSKMLSQYVTKEGLVAHQSTAACTNTQSSSAAGGINLMQSQKDSDSSIKHPLSVAGNQPSLSIKNAFVALPDTILPHVNSSKAGDVDHQNEVTEHVCISEDKGGQGNAGERKYSSASSQCSIDNTYQVTPVLMIPSREEGCGKPFNATRKEYSYVNTDCSSNTRSEIQEERPATKISHSLGSLSLFRKESVPAKRLKIWTSINDDHRRKRNKPNNPILPSKGGENLGSIENRYHLRSKVMSSNSTKFTNINDLKQTGKDNIQSSLGDESQEKPSAVQHVIKLSKRRKIKGKQASKDHLHFQQQVDDNEVFRFPERLDGMKEITNIVDAHDKGWETRKRTQRASVLMGRNNYKTTCISACIGLEN